MLRTFFLIETSSEPGYPGQGSRGVTSMALRQPCIGHCGLQDHESDRTHPFQEHCAKFKVPRGATAGGIAPGPPPKPITVTPCSFGHVDQIWSSGMPVEAVYRPLFNSISCALVLLQPGPRSRLEGGSLHRGLGGHQRQPQALTEARQTKALGD